MITKELLENKVQNNVTITKDRNVFIITTVDGARTTIYETGSNEEMTHKISNLNEGWNNKYKTHNAKLLQSIIDSNDKEYLLEAYDVETYFPNDGIPKVHVKVTSFIIWETSDNIIQLGVSLRRDKEDHYFKYDNYSTFNTDLKSNLNGEEVHVTINGELIRTAEKEDEDGCYLIKEIVPNKTVEDVGGWKSVYEYTINNAIFTKGKLTEDYKYTSNQFWLPESVWC